MDTKVTGEGVVAVKKIIAIFNFKQRLLSIDMKTKVVPFNFPLINRNDTYFGKKYTLIDRIIRAARINSRSKCSD